MKKPLVIIFLVLSGVAPRLLCGQDSWEVYLASYDDGVGSTTLDMTLIEEAPLKELPFLVITGVTFNDDCPSDGLPDSKMLNKLHRISQDVRAVIASTTQSRVAGTFTLQCERQEYVYVNDTLLLRDKLASLYKKKYKDFEYFVSIDKDDQWEAYRDFLYPNEETRDYLANERKLQELEKQGDHPGKPRPVQHRFAFQNAEGRKLFSAHLDNEGYHIIESSQGKDSDFPYVLLVSNTTAIQIDIISRLTVSLKKKVKMFNGRYDGWETSVVKS